MGEGKLWIKGRKTGEIVGRELSTNQMVIVDESKAVPIPNKDKATFRVLFIIKDIVQFICIFLPCPPDTFKKNPWLHCTFCYFFYECGVSVPL